MLDEDILQRIRQIAKDKKTTVVALAAALHLDASSLAKQMRGERGVSLATIRALLDDDPTLNPDWLIHGRGQQHRSHNAAPQPVAAQRGLPLLPVGAIAGYESTGWDTAVMSDDCQRYDIPEAAARGAELLIAVDGDSMMPTLASGDIMALRPVRDRQAFKWGRIYVLDTENGGFVKRVMPTDTADSVRLHSDNPYYPDFEMTHAAIRHIYDVVATVRML